MTSLTPEVRPSQGGKVGEETSWGGSRPAGFHPDATQVYTLAPPHHQTVPSGKTSETSLSSYYSVKSTSLHSMFQVGNTSLNKESLLTKLLRAGGVREASARIHGIRKDWGWNCCPGSQRPASPISLAEADRKPAGKWRWVKWFAGI